MSNEIEAAGGAITAGAAAGAIDGSEARRIGDGTACANCATAISGKYCVECGQPTHVHRSLFHFVEDAAHSIFHFDTRAWRTLPMLALRPGTLTRNYVMGKRARYISPVALFLFTIFLMFFIIALLGDVRLGVSPPQTLAGLRKDVAEAQASLNEAESRFSAESAKLAQMEAAPETLGPGDLAGQRGTVAGAQGTVTGAQASLRAAQEAVERREARVAKFERARDILKARLAQPANGDPEDVEKSRFALEAIERALANPTGPPDSMDLNISEANEVSLQVGISSDDALHSVFDEIKAANERGDIRVNTGNAAWDKKIRSKLENPELAWYKLQNTVYKFSFLLVPISLPFIWLIFFWKRGVTLFDHAVFGLYSLSFMSVLFIALVLVARLPAPIAEPIAGGFGTLAMFAIPAHMYFQMKGAYQLGWFSAFWRTLILLFFTLISLVLFIGVIFVLGLWG